MSVMDGYSRNEGFTLIGANKSEIAFAIFYRSLCYASICSLQQIAEYSASAPSLMTTAFRFSRLTCIDQGRVLAEGFLLSSATHLVPEQIDVTLQHAALRY
jgi:hypothetical protein